jgi:FtsZ-interacting cell division protein ZipA
MRAIIFLIIVALIALAFWALWSLSKSRIRHLRQRPGARWKKNERNTHEGYIVELVKPGQEPRRIGEPIPDDAEFAWNLELARSEAMEELVALNADRLELR